jgi:4-amino-4-deoxy-L-arabinose transferase-like glycosyltransferase
VAIAQSVSASQPNNPQFSPQLIFLSALAVIALGFGLRLYHLPTESLWYDELLQLDIAQGNPPGQGGLASIFPRLRGHAAVPLDYIISYFWIGFGRSEGWVRLPGVVVGTLTLAVVYQLGRKLFGPLEGLLLMFLLALSPFHLRYSQEARPYALAVLGISLAIYGFWRLHQTGRRRHFIPLQIGVLIFSLAHFFTWAIFIPLLIFVAIDSIFYLQRRRIIKTIGLLLASLVLPFIILLFSGWGGLFYTFKGFGEALVEPDKFTVQAEQKPNQGEGPKFSREFVKLEILVPLAGSVADGSLWLFNSLAGLGLVYLLAQRRYKLGLWLLLWLILPIAIVITFLVYRGAFFASRYIIYILPAYLSLVALGWLALPRWLRCAQPGWLASAFFLLTSLVVTLNLAGSLNRFYQTQHKENWRIVGEFINQNVQPDDAVIAMRAEPAVNWYYPRAWAAPNYFWDLAEIKETAAQARRSWVILSLFSAPVDAPVKLWLGEQGAVRFQLDPAITLYYVAPGIPPDQLLTEAQNFALPIDHALYASLGAQNRARPAVARQYYQLALKYAPDAETQATYQAALAALPQ